MRCAISRRLRRKDPPFQCCCRPCTQGPHKKGSLRGLLQGKNVLQGGRPAPPKESCAHQQRRQKQAVSAAPQSPHAHPQPELERTPAMKKPMPRHGSHLWQRTTPQPRSREALGRPGAWAAAVARAREKCPPSARKQRRRFLGSTTGTAAAGQRHRPRSGRRQQRAGSPAASGHCSAQRRGHGSCAHCPAQGASLRWWGGQIPRARGPRGKGRGASGVQPQR